jgi:hypothetical protein
VALIVRKIAESDPDGRRVVASTDVARRAAGGRLTLERLVV